MAQIPLDRRGLQRIDRPAGEGEQLAAIRWNPGRCHSTSSPALACHHLPLADARPRGQQTGGLCLVDRRGPAPMPKIRPSPVSPRHHHFSITSIPFSFHRINAPIYPFLERNFNCYKSLVTLVTLVTLGLERLRRPFKCHQCHQCHQLNFLFKCV